MTSSNGTSPSNPNADRAKRRATRSGSGAQPGPKGDQDIRHHPQYKTPWWRKPLKPYVFWIIVGVTLAVVIAAVVVTLSLGIALF